MKILGIVGVAAAYLIVSGLQMVLAIGAVFGGLLLGGVITSSFAFALLLAVAALAVATLLIGLSNKISLIRRFSTFG